MNEAKWTSKPGQGAKGRARALPHAPGSQIVHFPQSEPLQLDCGGALAPFSLAYQTYGTLNEDKSNVVLI